MIAWWIWLSTQWLGNTALGIRALPVLSVLVTTAAVFGTAIELEFDLKLARLAALWLNAMFLVGGVAIIATPDAPSMMFWALSTWALARLRRTGDPRLWIVVGICAGLGCVSKYTNLFLGLGIVVWCGADPKARRWLISPWMLAGGFTALAVFSPVIVWNANHHWSSFAKQFGRVDDGSPTWRYVGEFLFAQFGLLNPIIAIFMAIALGRTWKSRRRGVLGPLAFLIALSAPLVLYMLFHSIHDRVQGNWPAPIYPAIAILAAGAAVESGNTVRLKRLAGAAAPVGLVLPALALAFLATPAGDAMPLRAPTDLLLGWPALSATIEKYELQSGTDWLATADYGLTGELAFHLHSPHTVQEVVDRERYSFEVSDPSLAGKPALLVLRERDVKHLAFDRCFKSVEALATITRNAGHRVIERYKLLKVGGGPPDLLRNGCDPAHVVPLASRQH